MKLTQLCRILWARKGLMLVVLAVVVALVTLVSLVLPKTYMAEASVVISSKNTDPITGSQLQPQQLSSYLSTQINVITSRNVALKVVDDLKLMEHPERARRFFHEKSGRVLSAGALASDLLSDLDVRPSRESSVISIDFSARDARDAAEVANAFAQAYINTNLELTLGPARRQAAWFDEQVRTLRTALEGAQQRLSERQRDREIVATDEKLDIENSRLTDISTQLVAAQARMYESQTRQQQMNQALERGKLEEAPDVLGNALVQSMKADLLRAQGKLADLAERYGKNHPQYLSAAAEVQALQDRIATEFDKAKGSVAQSAQIAQRQTGELQRALDEQKARILALRQQHDELNVMNREVENAQHAYDAALQRASQVRLESRLEQTNIAVLDPASTPSLPARPRLLLNVALAIVLGSMLGAGTALSLELLDRRVRSAIDLEELAGLVVLAEVPRLSDGQQRRMLKAAHKDPVLLQPV